MDRLLSLDSDSMFELVTDCLTSLILRFTVETKDILATSSTGLEMFLKVLRMQKNCLLQKQAVEQVSIQISDSVLAHSPAA